MSLEAVWRQREEDVYPALFGPLSRGIFPLALELFTGQFGPTEVDPRWLHLGVMEYGPTPERPSWLYVTSGCSNPWDDEPEAYDPEGESGAGVEFTLATTEQGDWAIRQLQSLLAFDVLLSAGRYPGREPLAVHDRIPLRAPLDGREDCVLRNFILTEGELIPAGFALPSGKVLLFGFTAVSDAELDHAKAEGSAPLIDRLRAAGHHPVIDPRRASIF